MARNWLPRSAISSPPVRGALARVVDEWSSRWFATGKLRLAHLDVAPRPRGTPDAWPGWERRGALLWTRMTAAGEARLIELALDYQAARSRRHDADRALLNAFCEKIVDDLVAAMEAELRAGPDHAAHAQEGDVALELVDLDGVRTLTLSGPASAFADLVRTRLAPPKRPAALARRVDTLRTSPLVLEAHAGQTTITLGEMRGLARGDVLVLDRRVSDGVALALKGQSKLLASGDLGDIDGCAAITVTATSTAAMRSP